MKNESLQLGLHLIHTQSGHAKYAMTMVPEARDSQMQMRSSDPDSPEDLQWHAGEYQKPPYYYCSSFWGLKFIMQRLEVE